MQTSLAILLAIAMTTPMTSNSAAADETNPRELGSVRWRSELDSAKARSRATGRPVLILFQEIPGCATCTGFGDGPLSNPLLIEAIESEFEPVAIHNNRPGRDAEILASYGEPAWNNPVMRFVNAEGRDIVPRRDGLWTTHQVAERLVAALDAAHRPVPDYLRWVIDETDQARQKRGTFASAGEMSCATRVYAHTDDQLKRARAAVGARAERTTQPAASAPDRDRTYHLNGTRWTRLPLTPFQATRVNAALARGESPDRWLSPGQRALASRLAAADRGR